VPLSVPVPELGGGAGSLVGGVVGAAVVVVGVVVVGA